jgi:hypothetical protein
VSGHPYAEAKERVAASSKWFLDRYFSHHTRGPFTQMLAQNGGDQKYSTLVALEVRGAAQLTVPANVNLNRRVHLPPKLRRITPPANDTTSILQRSRFEAFLHDAFRGRGLGERRGGRKAEGEGSFIFAGGWGGLALH